MVRYVYISHGKAKLDLAIHQTHDKIEVARPFEGKKKKPWPFSRGCNRVKDQDFQNQRLCVRVAPRTSRLTRMIPWPFSTRKCGKGQIIPTRLPAPHGRRVVAYSDPRKKRNRRSVTSTRRRAGEVAILSPVYRHKLENATLT